MQENPWVKRSIEVSHMLSEINSEHEGAGSILNEFGGWSSDSTVLMAWEKFSLTKTLGGKRCNIVALAQRDWSIDIPLKLFYHYIENKDEVSPKKVTLKMIAKDHIEPLQATRTLTEKQLNEMYRLFLSTWEYDRSFFYNTAELISFTEVDNIELAAGERKIINMRVSIPSDFPQDLLGKSILIELKAETIPRAIGSQWSGLHVLVVR